MPSDPERTLLRGSELLKPTFSEHGFVFAQIGADRGSGGPFASAEFRRNGRRCELHFRWSLGLVTYHIGTESISHEEYMCSVLGKPNLSHYPGFSSDPLDAFHHLREDLQNYCKEFLEGSDEIFLSRISDARVRWLAQTKLPN